LKSGLSVVGLFDIIDFELAQEIALPEGEGVQAVRITGGADDIEYFDNGKVGNTVTVSGSPDTPCGGVAKPTVGTFFCVAPTIASAVNSAGGLPALGRVRIPGIVEVFP